jgi:hypothetical protein
MGGFSTTGVAWQYLLPPEFCHLQGINNLLEYMAAMLTIWMDIFHSKVLLPFNLRQYLRYRLVVQTFVHKPQPFCARKGFKKVGNTSEKSQSMLYPQHLSGDANRVTDILSREYIASDTTLTDFFRLKFPDQIPSNFLIYPLPGEISSWVVSTLGKWMAYCLEHKKPPMKNAKSPTPTLTHSPSSHWLPSSIAGQRSQQSSKLGTTGARHCQRSRWPLGIGIPASRQA